MNIGDILKSVMTFPEEGADNSHLRSNSKDGHWHDSKQWHEENAHLIYTGDE